MHEITHAPIDKRPLLHSSIEIEIDQDQSTNHHHTPITTHPKFDQFDRFCNDCSPVSCK